MKGILLFCSLLLASFGVVADDLNEWFAQPGYAPLFESTADRGAVALTPGRVSLTPGESDALILPTPGRAVELPSIDRFTGNEETPLRFRPLRLFARGALIRLLSPSGETLVPFPQRQYYLASNATTGVALAVDPATGAVSGFASRGGDRMQIGGDIIGELEFTPVEEAEPGTSSCANGEVDLAAGVSAIESSPIVPSASASSAGGTISYQAVVAIDTDTEWLAGFNNNTATASQWITDLFLAMNVFYERDVETQLLIGDVFLRTGSDPWSVASDRVAQLTEFGNYWRSNMGAYQRQFAAMLSGRAISPGWFSGIAWVDAYCSSRYSYSYNAIGTGRSAAGTALYVGHELGHNMGSPHTHCYSQPVDQCYSGGSSVDGPCYSGPVFCPAGGKGTIMSYCHVSTSSGGAGCGTSKSEFHPTVQARLEGRLANEMVRGCILPYEEENPLPAFSSTPSAGSTLQFGDHMLGDTSTQLSVQVANDGTADLTVSCALSGDDASSFLLQNCPSPVASALSGAIVLRCSPNALGALAATLTVATNDPDNATLIYALDCNGIPTPIPDVIFNQSFEGP